MPGAHVDEGLDELSALALGEQDVAEARLPRADEGHDAQAVARERDQRERAHEPLPPIGRLHREPTALPVVAPPLE
jgi:hypothetical protein